MSEPGVANCYDAPAAALKMAAAAQRPRFDALASAQLGFVCRSLRRLGVPDEGVDDAAQKVFFVVLRRIADIEEGRERAFLFKTAMNVAADSRRALARTRKRTDDQPLESVADPGPTPEQAIDRKRARALLDEALEAMDEDLRTVFVLFEMEGLTSPEIASLLGTPLGTVASRLRRSREEFHAVAKRLRARTLRPGGAP